MFPNPPPWQAQATSHAGCGSARKQAPSELCPAVVIQAEAAVRGGVYQSQRWANWTKADTVITAAGRTHASIISNQKAL
jgi:hypothetical protein